MTNELTIKSALKYLVKMQIEQGSVGFAVDNDHDHDCCWDDVLAWIEAQPSEDCISREEVQDLISRWLSDYLLDETREALETINYKVGDMPSVIPQRPKGKWISHREHCENLGVMPSGLGAYEWCSNCDCGIDVIEWHRNPYNYCPNCGAEMSGGGEDGAETR